MGLLTSDSGEDKNFLTDVFAKWNHLKCFMLTVIGIGLFFSLLTEPFVANTYFSDNALLPGLVSREFSADPTPMLLKLKEEVSRYGDSLPLSFLMSSLLQSGVTEVHTHNFSLHYPFSSRPLFTGTNVYGILRAGRAPSTEAIVISAPYRSGVSAASASDNNLPAVSLLLTMAGYLSKKNYWAKDIIFLVSDHELVGVESFLQSYHGMSTSDVLRPGFLPSKSGQIQAALNLEASTEKISRIDIKIEGMNGQLPNLDLFNVAVELSSRESVTPTFHGHPHSNQMKVQMETLLQMMTTQATSLPTGVHGLYHKYSIQALTLKGVMSKRKGTVSVPLTQMGRVVEGVTRSLNNLLERFNRSYWFYLLPSTRKYISSGFYMIPFGFLTLPLLFSALFHYMKPNGATTGQLVTALSGPFIGHCLGLILVNVPLLVQGYGDQKDMNEIYYSLLAINGLLMLTPLPIGRGRHEPHSLMSARLAIALLNGALLLGCLSLINISLALFLSLNYGVVLSHLRVTQPERDQDNSMSFAVQVIQKSLLLLVHPLVLQYLCLLIMSFMYDSSVPLWTHFVRSFEGQKKTILFYIEDWYIYGNHMFLLGCSFLFPMWYQFWSIL